MIKFYLHTPGLPGWQSMFLEVFEKMDSSGLLSDVDEVNFCFNGQVEDGLAVFGSIISPGSNLKFLHVSNDATKWEWPTINKIKVDADNDDSDHYVGYGHLKGLSRSPTVAVTDWRHMLHYWTIEKWKDNIALLDAGYDTVGLNWMDSPWPHYSGNSWWSTGSYLRRLGTLQDPATLNGTVSKYLVPNIVLDPGNYKYECEAWIGSGHPNHATMHQSHTESDPDFHYHSEYPESRYRK